MTSPSARSSRSDMISEWLGADPRRCGWSPKRDRERPRAWGALLSELAARPPEHGLVKHRAGPAAWRPDAREVASRRRAAPPDPPRRRVPGGVAGLGGRAVRGP